MVISGYSTANQPIISNVVNLGFAFAQKVTSPATTKDVIFQPEPIPVPPITQYGVTVNFPPITPPPITRTITIPGGSYSVNPYECVGFVMTGPIRLCALIRSDLVAMANHYAPPAGTSVNFYTQNGVVSGVLDSISGTFGDLDIWHLKSPISGVTPTNTTSLTQQIWYAGKPIVSFGLVGSRTLAPYSWAPAATTGKILRALNGTGGIMTCTAMLDNGSVTEPGDSGSPNFFTWNGAPYYLGSDRKMGSTNEINMIHPWVSRIANL